MDPILLRQIAELTAKLREVAISGSEPYNPDDVPVKGQFATTTRLGYPAIKRYERAVCALREILQVFPESENRDDTEVGDAITNLAEKMVKRTIEYRKLTGDENADISEANSGWKNKFFSAITDEYLKQKKA